MIIIKCSEIKNELSLLEFSGRFFKQNNLCVNVTDYVIFFLEQVTKETLSIVIHKKIFWVNTI
jgi:hypothetical protein